MIGSPMEVVTDFSFLTMEECVISESFERLLDYFLWNWVD